MLLLHPDVAKTDCESCRLYVIENGQPAQRHGQPLRRPPGGKPPCETKAGCPKGHWSKPATMRLQDWLAFDHYRRCKLTGQWPDDAIVIERGVALQSVEETVAIERDAMLMSAGLTALRSMRK